MVEQHIATVELTSDLYDARCANGGRIVTVSALSNATIRVKIEAQAPEGNCRFVVLSDMTMTVEDYRAYIRPRLVDGTVRIGSLGQ